MVCKSLGYVLCKKKENVQTQSLYLSIHTHSGKKRWILFDPNESKLLFDRHGRNVIPDITKPCPSTYPNAHRARRIECTQHAGEVMFVPSGYYHQVLNMTDCVSVNHNGLNSENAFSAWHFLRQEYLDSRRAIEHLQSTFETMSEFENQVQSMMKTDCGFDISRWIDMLRLVVSRCMFIETRLDDEIRPYNPNIEHVCDLNRVAGKLRQQYPKCNNAREICYEVLVRQNVFANVPILFFSRSRVADYECFLPSDWKRRLSNFWPCDVNIFGYSFPSVEHAFQASKYLCCSEPQDLASKHGKMFMGTDCAFDAPEAKKRGGRKYMTSLGVSLDVKRWNEIAKDVMLTLLRSRWHHDAEFRDIMIETQRQGFHLVHFERSGSSSFWGGCISKEDGTVRGNNMLGRMLMTLAQERMKSRSLSIRRVREVLMEMRKHDSNVIRAAGQMKRFLDLCAFVGVGDGRAG